MVAKALVMLLHVHTHATAFIAPMWNGIDRNPSFEAEAVCAHVLNKPGYEPQDVQVDAIRAVMAGKDTLMLVVSGTGGGKSLIYQMLPELREEGSWSCSVPC